MIKYSDFVRQEVDKTEPQYPHVSSLGDGTYKGIMSGYIFKYKDNYYKCSFGVRGLNIEKTITIKNGVDTF